MDRKANFVVKSKSSNNAIPLKTARKNKKTLSNVDVTPGSMKKRGTSDRRIFKSPLRQQEPRRKPPPRPRPGQKKFLTSVLSILSKSTTGTQHPDVQERVVTKNSKRTRSRYDHEEEVNSDITNKQGKYKSRILNRNTNNISDQFIVLQSMKELAQTPSNYSEANDTQNEKPRKLSIRDILSNNLRNEAVDAKRGVLEEMVRNEKKIRIKDEPESSTLAEEGDKKLYNLFVDILESTFNVYDLQEDKLSDSNTALEINESVAKKLRIDNKALNESTCFKRKERKMGRENVFEKPIDIKLSEHKRLKRVKRKISVKSFVYSKKTDTPETKSLHGTKKYYKNRRKNVLLNIFKEELKLMPTLEEPLTLYQALKIMAKNKKIKRDKSKEHKTYGELDRSKCLLKRRRIINMKTKKDDKVNIEQNTQKYSEYNSKFKKLEKTSIPSHHSLEVYEYNSEESDVPKVVRHQNKYQEKRNKTENLTKSFSPFVMHSNYDYYTLLKFPDRSTYDFTY